MPAKFCSNCGRPPALPARYCDHCGAMLPVPDAMEDRASYLAAPHHGPQGPGPRASKPLRGEDEAVEESDKQNPATEKTPEDIPERIYWIDAHMLTRIFTCAFRNAPLSTEFLILRDKARGCEQAVPLYCIYSLKGLEVVNSAKVEFLMPIKGILDRLGMNFQDVLTDEVMNAYVKTTKDPTLCVEVVLSFDPELLSDPCATLPGRFENGKSADPNTLEEGEEALVDVLMDSRSLMSGIMMKHNLRKYVNWYSKYCIPRGDEITKEHKEVLEYLRDAIKIIPDTFEAHLHCFVTYWDHNGPLCQTRLSDDNERVGRITIASGAPRMRGTSYGLHDVVSSSGRIPQIAVARRGAAIAYAGKTRHYGRCK